MRRAQQGDGLAYADLLMLLTPVCARFVRRRAGAVRWVDDVVQETLLTVHRSRHTYDPSRPFVPWFYAIASTRLIDVWRRERRVLLHEAATDALPEPAVGDDDTRSTIDPERIRAAVRALPERQRVVIQALKYDGDTARATAERLGVSEASVKITAHRGYKALRRLLGAADDED